MSAPLSSELRNKHSVSGAIVQCTFVSVLVATVLRCYACWDGLPRKTEAIRDSTAFGRYLRLFG